MTKLKLPLAIMDKIMKEAGAYRISDKAKVELANILKEVGLDISKLAIELYKHSGRKTIKGEDIKLASKTYLKR